MPPFIVKEFVKQHSQQRGHNESIPLKQISLSQQAETREINDTLSPHTHSHVV